MSLLALPKVVGELAEAGRDFYGIALIPVAVAMLAFAWRHGPRLIEGIFALAASLTRLGDRAERVERDAADGVAVGKRVEGGVARLEAGLARVEAEVVELRVQLAEVVSGGRRE